MFDELIYYLYGALYIFYDDTFYVPFSIFLYSFYIYNIVI